ncbi:MAG: hypothetical protein GTO22_14350 [Gemmatimonadales bacterium]|nr:hypothetical protein [Gemmatimonadales bacterium]
MTDYQWKMLDPDEATIDAAKIAEKYNLDAARWMATKYLIDAFGMPADPEEEDAEDT